MPETIRTTTNFADEEIVVYQGEGYEYTLGYDDELRVNALDTLPDDRWLAFLKRLRKHVETAPYDEDDSNATGDKHTHFSWGACCDEPKLWPDKQDLIWPEEPPVRGKASPLTRAVHQRCPFEVGTGPAWAMASGCYYRCAVFQHKGGQVAREQALELIDRRIVEAEKHRD